MKVNWQYPPGRPGDDNLWVGVYNMLDMSKYKKYKMLTRNEQLGVTRFTAKTLQGLADGDYIFTLPQPDGIVNATLNVEVT